MDDKQLSIMKQHCRPEVPGDGSGPWQQGPGTFERADKQGKRVMEMGTNGYVVQVGV